MCKCRPQLLLCVSESVWICKVVCEREKERTWAGILCWRYKTSLWEMYVECGGVQVISELSFSVRFRETDTCGLAFG